MTEEHLQKISAHSLASIYHFLCNAKLIRWQTQQYFPTKSTTFKHLPIFFMCLPPPLN